VLVRQVQIQINPGDIKHVSISSSTSIFSKTYKVGTPIALNLVLRDRYNNVAYAFKENKPTVPRLKELVSVFHFERKPVSTHYYLDGSLLKLNLTSHYAGYVYIESPLFDAPSDNF